MFDGERFVALEKKEVGVYCGFTPYLPEEHSISVALLINVIDRWARQYGYEYHSMFIDCVVFKRIS